MKNNEISDYLEAAKTVIEHLNCVKNVSIVDNSLLVHFREKKLDSGWRQVLKKAKPFTKLHYIITVYENRSKRAKYLHAESLFNFKNTRRSLYFYYKNNL